MTRLALTLVAWMSLAAVAPASLSPRKERTTFDAEPTPRVPSAPRSAQATRPADPSEYVVTKRTEVLLDGQPCHFEDVPERASILRMEVAPDGKTVLRVFFRSQK
jgi:hypothetical protein